MMRSLSELWLVDVSSMSSRSIRMVLLHKYYIVALVRDDNTCVWSRSYVQSITPRLFKAGNVRTTVDDAWMITYQRSAQG